MTEPVKLASIHYYTSSSVANFFLQLDHGFLEGKGSVS